MAEPSLVDQVKALQAQINRFVSPKLPVTGALDPATARAAATIMLQRYQLAFAESPAKVASQIAEIQTALANPLPWAARDWVAKNLIYVTSVIRDYGDFSGKPPPGAGVPRWLFPTAIGAALAAFFFFRGR